MVWSRHVTLFSGHKLELTFARTDWASTAPIDAGTIFVVRDAFRVLHDPTAVLSKLMAAVGEA